MNSTDRRALAERIRQSPTLVVRAGWGSLLFVGPDTGLRFLGAPCDAAGSARSVLRILGARHLAEVALELRRGPSWRRVGGVVDALHATSALAFAAFDRRWRRAALLDALIAGTFAATEIRSRAHTLGAPAGTAHRVTKPERVPERWDDGSDRVLNGNPKT